MTVLQMIETEAVVAIVRTRDPESAAAMVGSIKEAGLGVVEVALTTPGALGVIEQVSGSTLVGAGTVRTLDDARAAVAAGASFLVSPTLNLDVVRFAAERDLVCLPGCLTPTEMTAAVDAGAQAVKIFPAHLWSPGALAGMLQALPHLRTVPTGGIGPADAAAWIRAGALAVGIGASITTSPDPAATVARLREEIASARAGS